MNIFHIRRTKSISGPPSYTEVISLKGQVGQGDDSPVPLVLTGHHNAPCIEGMGQGDGLFLSHFAKTALSPVVHWQNGTKTDRPPVPFGIRQTRRPLPLCHRSVVPLWPPDIRGGGHREGYGSPCRSVAGGPGGLIVRDQLLRYVGGGLLVSFDLDLIGAAPP